MILLVAGVVLFIVSLILAIRAADTELSVPEEVKHLRLPRPQKISGVILFLKKKIIHYSSDSSVSSF